MKTLAYIPARSGSKGVPGKNVKKVAGVPLLEYTVHSAVEAKKSGVLTDVFVSTDSREYLRAVSEYDIVEGYVRPPHYATDDSPTIDGIRDAIKHQANLGVHYDYVMILQPTSPFRTPTHISDAIEMLSREDKASSLASVVKLGDHHPCRIKKIDEKGFLRDFCRDALEPEPSRRQDFHPSAYIRNGCIYLTPVRLIEEAGLIRGRDVLSFIMAEANSVNIDNHLDYLVAEMALRYEEYRQDLKFFVDFVKERNGF